MPFYVKKAQELHTQLIKAQETISAFNQEEAIFNLPISSFPMRKEILASLEPYQLLYSTTMNFQRGSKRWMEGAVLEIDSEKVEAEVDSMRRELLRLLTSSFVDEKFESPRQIAKLMLEKVAEFREHIPLLHVLCNPGMRDRHWTKMSELAAIDIKPDATSNLKKMLKLNLEPHLSAFQEISGESYFVG
jgi:dynein heavy chain